MRSALKDKRGFVMLLALFVVSVVLTHSMVGLTRATGELLTARHYAAVLQAFHYAEAGMDVALAEVLRGGADGVVTFAPDEGWTDARGEACGVSPACRQAMELNGTRIEVTVSGRHQRAPVITASAAYGGARQQVEVVVEGPPPSPFTGPIVAADQVEFGSMTIIDSYDSALGEYGAPLWPADAVYGTLNQSDPFRPSSWQGTVVCDSTAQDALSLGSGSQLFGDALIAVDGVPSIAVNGYGSTIYGEQAPAPAPLELAPVQVPPGSPSGVVLTVPSASSTTVDLQACGCSSIVVEDGASLTLQGDGLLHLDDLRMSGHANLRLEGEDVTFVVGGFETDTHSTLGAVGAVTIYGTGARPISLQAYNAINPGGDPSRWRMYVAGTQPVTIGNHETFSGIIYAPQADVAVSVQSDFFGSIVGRRVTVGTHTNIHYDQQLSDFGEDAQPYTVKSWRQPTP